MERHVKQDKVLPCSSCPASWGSISDPGFDPHSSSRRPLRCPPRTAHHSLLTEWLLAVWGSGIPSSLQGPETFSPDEQDARPSPWWLQTGLHPQRTSSCLRCQQSKIQSHVKSTVPSIDIPGRHFSHLYLDDHVGPLPSSQGYNYLLTMIDRTSRWPKAIPLSFITEEKCAWAFISTWVSRFGVPTLLTSDRGAQFTCSIWLEVCSIVGISRIKLPASILRAMEWLSIFIALSKPLS